MWKAMRSAREIGRALAIRLCLYRWLRALGPCLAALCCTLAAPVLGAEPQPAPSASRETPRAPAAPRARADQARNFERPARGFDAADVALLVPRLVLTIPRLALRLAFLPLQKALKFVDRHAAIERAVGAVGAALPVKREADPLAAREMSGGVAPQVELDSFHGLSFGLKAFHDDLAGHGEYGSIEARVGGVYDAAGQLAFRAARFGGSRLWLESLTRYESQSSLLFQGIGQDGAAVSGAALDSRQAAVATRYTQARTLDILRLGYSAGDRGRLLQLGATGRYSVRDLSGSAAADGPSLESVYDSSKLPGFGERVTTLETDLNLAFDTLDPPRIATSGAYVSAYAGRVPELAGYGYWHAGIDATLYVNLYRGNRLLILRAFAESVAGRAEHIPFADLPSLGGPHRLRGYPLDRFRDENAALGSVEYHYPIHQYVAGSLFVEAGRVERSFSSCFDGHWLPSIGGGFFVRSKEKQIFSMHVAGGEGVQLYFTTDPWQAFSNRETDL
jgi:hypothetical protein